MSPKKVLVNKSKSKRQPKPTDVNDDISIGNAKIVFRNFEGRPGVYNVAGQRNFSVLLDDAQAAELKAIGWNVKYMKPKDPDEKPQAHLPVKVSYDNYPPIIYLIGRTHQKLLDSETVKILDWAEIKYVDLVIKPYNWETLTGGHGVKAYAKAMYVTIVEDEFASKYQNPPDSSQSSLFNEDEDGD